jgi:hypothetical protein
MSPSTSMTSRSAHPAEGRRLLAYYGHHKCASTWLAGILARTMDEIGLRYLGAYDVLAPSAIGQFAIYGEPPVLFDRSALREQVDARGADLVTVGGPDRELAAILRPGRAFHVIRDPRDLVVSGYFSHLNSHPVDGLPHLREHRRALQSVSPQEGLLLEMDFATNVIKQIGDWDYTDRSVLELKMEDLTVHPYENFIQIFRHLGLLAEDEPTSARDEARIWTTRVLNRLSKRRPSLHPLRRTIPATGELVLGTVYAHRFETITRGRARGVENVMSHYRKGVAGDWINHFTRQHAEAFEASFGDLLIRLGYEENSDWIDLTRDSA